MNREIHNKLIRDKIPQIISANKSKFKISILNNKQFRNALKKKLLEEALELEKAKTKEEILNELSDVLEIVENISKQNHISMRDVEKSRQKKFIERGGFDKRLFLKYTYKEERKD